MSIVFGSPEAVAILQKDRELKRQQEQEEREREEEAKRNSPEALTARLREVESEIAALEDELNWLRSDRDELEDKINAAIKRAASN